MGSSSQWAYDQEQEEKWKAKKDADKEFYSKREEKTILTNSLPKEFTLTEYNQLKAKEYSTTLPGFPRLNHILCDKCQTELHDLNGKVKYFRDHNVKERFNCYIEVICLNCKFRGNRLV